LLIRRDSGSIQIAAKGTGIVTAVNQAFLAALFTQKPFLSRLLRLLRKTKPEDMPQALPEGSASLGFPVEWARLRTDIDLTSRNRLFPWAGAYQTEAGRLILLKGDGDKAKLFIDGKHVRQFTFKQGVLEWKADASIGEHGYLKSDVDIHGKRRWVGSIWPEGDATLAKHRLVAWEGEPGRCHVSESIGQYAQAGSAGSELLALEVADSPTRGRHILARLNGQELSGPFTYANGALSVGGRKFTLARSASGKQEAWVLHDKLPAALAGIYRVNTAGGGGLKSFSVGNDGILINGSIPAQIDQQYGQVAWTGGPPSCPSGQVNLLLDAVTLYPGLFGSVDAGNGKLHKCFGKVTPPPDLHRPEPEFGLSPQAWEHLVKSVVNGEWYFWQQWEKANLAALWVNMTLAKLLP
jgi:hypothetical protein